MPLIAVLFGVVFLDERLGLHALVGMALILAGSLVVNARGATRAPPSAQAALAGVDASAAVAGARAPLG